jgi:hypothetical protein
MHVLQKKDGIILTMFTRGCCTMVITSIQNGIFEWFWRLLELERWPFYSFFSIFIDLWMIFFWYAARESYFKAYVYLGYMLNKVGVVMNKSLRSNPKKRKKTKNRLCIFLLSSSKKICLSMLIWIMCILDRKMIIRI